MLRTLAKCPRQFGPLGGQGLPLVTRRFDSSKSKDIQFTLDQAGLISELYVPPKNLPSWFIAPKSRWTALKRWIRTVGINTYMAVKLRRGLGRSDFQPLEWKETAILLYSRMNECFVNKDLRGLSKITSRWVYGPLSARSEKLPANVRLKWSLVKFNTRPKVVSMIPLSFPERPLRFVQVLYTFDSKQLLSKVDLKTNKVEKVERDVVDHVAFIFDARAQPVKARVIGSLFETPVSAPVPDPAAGPTARAEILQAMTVRGDIFREPPKYLAVKPEEGA